MRTPPSLFSVTRNRWVNHLVAYSNHRRAHTKDCAPIAHLGDRISTVGGHCKRTRPLVKIGCWEFVAPAGAMFDLNRLFRRWISANRPRGMATAAICEDYVAPPQENDLRQNVSLLLVTSRHPG